LSSSVGVVTATVEAIDNASPVFEGISADAATMSSNITADVDSMNTSMSSTDVSLRTIGSGIASVGRMGMDITSLASSFGLVDSQTAKYMRTIMTMIELVGTAARVYNFLTLITQGHSATVAVDTTAETANTAAIGGQTAAETALGASVAAETAEQTASTGALSLSTIASNVWSGAMGVATAVCDALDISYGTFLMLTGVGIALVIAAAAAMMIFANNMNQATSSVKSFNAAAATTPTATSNIQRAGEQQLLRRGIK
jgi:hypothetical protein